MPSELPEPGNWAEIEIWIEERSQKLADKIARLLQEIVDRVYSDFIASVEDTTLTAAGDPGIIDNIIPMWSMVIPEIMTDLEETYYAGGISAFGVAQGHNPIPQNVAEGWAAVVNQSALEYISGATNRMKDVGETLWKDVSNKARQAIEQGMGRDELAQQLRYLNDRFSGYRADAIARTEVNAAYINGDYEADLALGPWGPVEKVWVSTSDARTRPDHVAANNQVRPFSEPFSIGGTPMMVPHASGAPASQVVNCRCHYESLYVGDRRPDGSIVGEGDLVVQTPDGTEVEIVPEGSAPQRKAAVVRPGPSTTSVLDRTRTGSRLTARTADRDVPMNEALENLNRIVGVADDGLPQTVISPASVQDWSGSFDVTLGGFIDQNTRLREVSSMMIRAATPNPGLKARIIDEAAHHRATVYHEFGHRLDFMGTKPGLSDPSRWASKEGLQRLREIQQNTVLSAEEALDLIEDPLERAWAELSVAYWKSESRAISESVGHGLNWMRYNSDPTEIWARAFSQWSAEQVGDTAALTEMFSRIPNFGEFTETDMKVVGPIVERILRLRGLIE